MKKYLIDNLDVSGDNAGPKARADIRYFLHQMGFNDLINTNKKISWLQKQDILWRKIFTKIQDLNSRDVVVIQYPIYSKVLMKRLLQSIQKRGTRCYLIIHDLESLRIFKKRLGFQKYEISLINQTSGIIVHNNRMKERLQKLGVKVPMVALQLFDYHANGMLPNHFNDHSLVFAGNTMKAGFLKKWNLDIRLDVYGENHPHLNRVYYYGSVNAEKLPGKLTESYGLIWDGNQTNSCSGMYGDYLRYNNPHKLSLYLCAGMSVITWGKAAITDFITQNQVGFVVDNLTEIDQKITEISDEQYQQMATNAIRIAKEIRQGRYIKTAVEKLIRV